MMSDGAGVVEAVAKAWRSSGQATMSFLLLPSMAGWLPSGPVCNLAARQAMASTALPPLFGTGSDGFHARARGWSHAEAATITGRCHCVADAGRDGQIKTGDTVLVLGTAAFQSPRCRSRRMRCGGYCHVVV